MKYFSTDKIAPGIVAKSRGIAFPMCNARGRFDRMRHDDGHDDARGRQSNHRADTKACGALAQRLAQNTNTRVCNQQVSRHPSPPSTRRIQLGRRVQQHEGVLCARCLSASRAHTTTLAMHYSFFDFATKHTHLCIGRTVVDDGRPVRACVRNRLGHCPPNGGVASGCVLFVRCALSLQARFSRSNDGNRWGLYVCVCICTQT